MEQTFILEFFEKLIYYYYYYFVPEIIIIFFFFFAIWRSMYWKETNRNETLLPNRYICKYSIRYLGIFEVEDAICIVWLTHR